MSIKSYPNINCSNNNTAVKTIGNQTFCVSAPSSTFAVTDSISVKINGTFKIPTNITYTPSSVRIDEENISCPEMTSFSPLTSNIKYACNGNSCPKSNSNVSMNRNDVSQNCNLRTISGPNVILVHKYKDVSNYNVVDSSIQNQPAYNNILAFTEGNSNICPENEWDKSTGNNSIDTRCYCPMNKIKKYTDVTMNKIKCA
jgi:hypothetical protein